MDAREAVPLILGALLTVSGMVWMGWKVGKLWTREPKETAVTMYRKKPIVVDAEQWFPGNGCRGVRDDFPPDKGGVHKLCGCTLVAGRNAGSPHVHPTRADHGILVEAGDWIIAEQDGSGYYPCKPDIFEATYEPV